MDKKTIVALLIKTILVGIFGQLCALIVYFIITDLWAVDAKISSNIVAYPLTMLTLTGFHAVLVREVWKKQANDKYIITELWIRRTYFYILIFDLTMVALVTAVAIYQEFLN